MVVPEYKDKRILKHAESKRQEVLKYRQEHKDQCSYISTDFVIDVKVAEDFKLEISRIMRNDLGGRMDLTFFEKKNISTGQIVTV